METFCCENERKIDDKIKDYFKSWWKALVVTKTLFIMKLLLKNVSIQEEWIKTIRKIFFYEWNIQNG